MLQRIAGCYLIAMLICLRPPRGQLMWAADFLLAYWVRMACVPFPVNIHGEIRYLPGVFEQGYNLSAYVDNLVLNGPVIGMHVWKVAKTWDPEGIVSTLPAIATCLFGVLADHLLRTRRSEGEKTAWLMIAGVMLMGLREGMNLWLPINKSLWTSSYAVLMVGLTMIGFGVAYGFVDVKGCRTLVKPFAIYGMNAITVFLLSGVLGRLLAITITVATAAEKPIAIQSYLYETCFAPFANPTNASLLWAVMWVAMLYAVAYAMYRKTWFVKF